jgi:hypothetical protein
MNKPHHRAKLPYQVIREMRDKREANRHRWTYLALANQYGCGESTARDIVNYRTRVTR